MRMSPQSLGCTSLTCLGRVLVVALLWASFGAQAQEGENACGSLAASFGPFDYRGEHFKSSPGDPPYAAALQLVEGAHFTPPVEQLIRGATGTLPGGDLEYTLRVFPNHHRALIAVARLWERTRTPQPPGMARPAECYFERALRFRPDDNVARMLYSSFLLKNGRKGDAVSQLGIAKRDASDNAFTQYNIGMIYFDAGLYDEALQQAHRAMALGLIRQELSQRLSAAGRWKDPSPGTAPANNAVTDTPQTAASPASAPP